MREIYYSFQMNYTFFLRLEARFLLYLFKRASKLTFETTLILIFKDFWVSSGYYVFLELEYITYIFLIITE